MSEEKIELVMEIYPPAKHIKVEDRYPHPELRRAIRGINYTGQHVYELQRGKVYRYAYSTLVMNAELPTKGEK